MIDVKDKESPITKDYNNVSPFLDRDAANSLVRCPKCGLVHHFTYVIAGTCPATPQDVKKFDTGAVRSKDADGFRYDLITPIGLAAVAEAYQEGSVKYGDFNCERGFPVHDLLNHAIKHLYTYLSGDRSEPHLGHAAWNVLMAIHSEKMWPELNEGHLRKPGCKPPLPPAVPAKPRHSTEV